MRRTNTKNATHRRLNGFERVPGWNARLLRLEEIGSRSLLFVWSAMGWHTWLVSDGLFGQWSCLTEVAKPNVFASRCMIADREWIPGRNLRGRAANNVHGIATDEQLNAFPSNGKMRSFATPAHARIGSRHEFPSKPWDGTSIVARRHRPCRPRRNLARGSIVEDVRGRTSCVHPHAFRPHAKATRVAPSAHASSVATTSRRNSPVGRVWEAGS